MLKVKNLTYDIKSTLLSRTASVSKLSEAPLMNLLMLKL